VTVREDTATITAPALDPERPVEVGPWWRHAVVYQIYPRSFADANSDGIGDLAGVRAHLDHLAWLGVEAIWMSPFYKSPMYDAGYDVADYCDVDPLFGDLDEFDALVDEAHRLGLRILIDWVPNHTSHLHPWFVDSRSSRESPRRDWYVWRDQPNNWRAALGAGSAWAYDEATGQYYLHLFLPEQPDLNWRNPEVVGAMHQVLSFWLDRGVDGFRIDVAHCIGKDPQFRDEPRSVELALSDFNDQPYSHEVLRGVRSLVDSYPGDRVIVGEVNIRSTDAVAAYYGNDDELHLAFNFLPLDSQWKADSFRAMISQIEGRFSAPHMWPTWVLSNHDNERHRTRYGGSLAHARAAAVLLLTLRGTPFMYQGEELGLEDATVDPDHRVDPGGRDGCRAPIPWTRDPAHGWTGAPPWLPFSPESSERSVEALRDDPASILHLYRRALRLRRESPALHAGSFAWLASDPQVLAYTRRFGGDARAIVVNFASEPGAADLKGDWVIDLDSTGAREGARWDGTVGGDQALIIRNLSDLGSR
jgi:alpha-glucosidase